MITNRGIHGVPHPLSRRLRVNLSIGRLSGVGTLWDYGPRVCGVGGACAAGGVPLGAVPAPSWQGEVL